MKDFKSGDRIQTTDDFGGVHHGEIFKEDRLIDPMCRGNLQLNRRYWIVIWDDEHRRTAVNESYLKHEIDCDYIPND